MCHGKYVETHIIYFSFRKSKITSCSAVGQVPAAESCRGELPAHTHLLAAAGVLPSSISVTVATGKRTIYQELELISALPFTHSVLFTGNLKQTNLVARIMGV